MTNSAKTVVTAANPSEIRSAANPLIQCFQEEFFFFFCVNLKFIIFQTFESIEACDWELSVRALCFVNFFATRCIVLCVGFISNKLQNCEKKYVNFLPNSMNNVSREGFFFRLEIYS